MKRVAVVMLNPMLAGSARSFGLVIAATFAITACSSSTQKAIDRKDSGTTSPDVGPGTDLSADRNPIYGDAAADVTVVTTDTRPDTPVLGPDGATPDTTIIKNDSGPDSNVVQKDTATDAVVGDVVVDVMGPLACTGTLVLGTLPLVETGNHPASVAWLEGIVW